MFLFLYIISGMYDLERRRQEEEEEQNKQHVEAIGIPSNSEGRFPSQALQLMVI